MMDAEGRFDKKPEFFCFRLAEHLVQALFNKLIKIFFINGIADTTQIN